MASRPKRTRSNKDQGATEKLISIFKYSNDEEIVATLKKAVKANSDLAELLLSHFQERSDSEDAGPKPSHCVRCHKSFNEAKNGPASCKKKHTERPDVGSYGDYVFECCGKRISREGLPMDKDLARETAEKDKYCYETKHTTEYEKTDDPSWWCCADAHDQKHCQCPACTEDVADDLKDEFEVPKDTTPKCSRCGGAYTEGSAPGKCFKKHTSEPMASIFSGDITYTCCGKKFPNPTKDINLKISITNANPYCFHEDSHVK